MSGPTTWVTTSTILEKLRLFEDEDAWERLVDRFREPILAFARAMRLGPFDAEDVAQETLTTFARLLRDGRYDRDRGRLSHWLFGIARMKILDHQKREARRHRILPNEGRDPDGVADADPEELWERSWEIFVAETCVARVRTELSADAFRAFEMVVLAERKPGEVAEELGVDVKSIYNAKHRALQRIREIRGELERVEVA